MAAGLYDITSETLGKGHFAVVKLAKHCLTGEFVAVKVIDKTKLNNEGLLQLGLEIRLLSRLSEHQHPNIVKLYQVIDTKTKLYLVMEYCGRDVCDLFDYIQKRNSGSGLTEQEAKHIFRQICSAISYCHSLRIVHRDLKPENILIVTQPPENDNSAKYPIVKLIDFGFSNQWDEGEKLRTSCGSLAYSAPEILLGNKYDGDKVDIWGLGCILYILLYGSNPFMQINDSETLIRILDCTFTTPSRPNISTSATELIKSLLKKEPSSRLTIKQVVALSWLVDGRDDFKSNDKLIEAAIKNPRSPHETPSKINYNNVHERVIDQMISQQMCLSRDHVERALKATRDNAPVTTSSCTTSAVAVATTPLTIANTPESVEPEGELANSDKENIGSTNYNYVTATYNLLKDKLIREIQGISQNGSNVHEIRVGSSHQKRGQNLRQRRQLQQAPRFAPRFTPMATVSKQPLGVTTEANSSGSVTEDGATSPSTMDAAAIPETSDEPFALPLQRKCSIVSEEGSCTGADLSGRDSEGCGSDVHTFLLADEADGVTVRRSHPAVNIVVTDYSCTNSALTDDHHANILEELELNETDLVDESVTVSLDNVREGGGGPDSKLGTTATSASCSVGDKLHQVSSSPDFRRNLEEAEERDAKNIEVLTRSKAESAKQSRRPVTMLISSHQDSSHVNDIERHHSRKQKGRLVSNEGNSSVTSMRVIMQSKSCNNIVFKDSDDPGEGGQRDGKNGHSKGLSSGCGQLIKRNKGDRTDCCSIC